MSSLSHPLCLNAIPKSTIILLDTKALIVLRYLYMKMSREARLAYMVACFWSKKTITLINMSRYKQLVKALELERRLDNVEGYWIGSRLVTRKFRKP